MSSAAKEEPTAASRNTGHTPGDDWKTRWSNLMSYMTGSMTPEGRMAWRREGDIRTEEADIKACESEVRWLLKHSPVIRFLNEHIQKLGGDINSDNIYSRRCDDYARAGGYHHKFGIELCANVFRNRGHIEDTLAHEMIHAWDHLRFKIQPSNLRHVACLEVRAANLSGECRFVREFFTRGNHKITRQHQECVRNRAVRSVSMRTECKDREQAERLVDEVWDSCTRDTRPFDDIYR